MEPDSPETELQRRIKFFLKYVTKISANSNYGAIIKVFGDELLDEMSEQPEEKLAYYLHKLAGMVAWVATGNEYETINLPPDFKWLLSQETPPEAEEDAS
jgi:hypothetical protein